MPTKSARLIDLVYGIIIIIYYKIVHEVHDKQTYSKNNKNSKREH